MADHVYTAGGVYDITVTVHDDDGGEGEMVTTAYVTGVGVNNGVLTVVGTDERDVVSINRVNGRLYQSQKLLT